MNLLFKMWNPKAEWLAGKLCEKGLMKERYDESSDKLVRKMTDEGKKFARVLLSTPKWRKFMVEEFQKMRAPLEVKRAIWFRLLKFLKENNK